ncbi:MAG: transporter substrate-binding domain-containing protein [Coriobacteriales bacterium]|nr:transporter substrate-binding domain-containing protein [Coriobacteriales bacterium]
MSTNSANIEEVLCTNDKARSTKSLKHLKLMSAYLTSRLTNGPESRLTSRLTSRLKNYLKSRHKSCSQKNPNNHLKNLLKVYPNKHLCKRLVIIATLIALLCLQIPLAGCAGTTGSKQQTLSPIVSPPTVNESGKLKVGVDTTRVPFAGSSNGKIVGIDVDVASALAEAIGLKVSIIDIAGKNADDLLNNGTLDVVMDVEQGGVNVSQGKQIGPYLLSGPALFTKVRSSSLPDVDIRSLIGTKIFAQKDSLSAWTVDEVIGKGTANSVTYLADAIKAVSDGTTTYAAADAVVGAYLALGYDNVSCVKLLGNPIGIYCAVNAQNSALAEALTTALRGLRDKGQLLVVLSKWLGPVSAQVVLSNQAVVSQNTGTTTAPTVTAPSEDNTDSNDSNTADANAEGTNDTNYANAANSAEDATSAYTGTVEPTYTDTSTEEPTYTENETTNNDTGEDIVVGEGNETG